MHRWLFDHKPPPPWLDRVLDSRYQADPHAPYEWKGKWHGICPQCHRLIRADRDAFCFACSSPLTDRSTPETTETYPMPKDLRCRVFDIHDKLRDLEQPEDPDGDVGPRGIAFDSRLTDVGFWLPSGREADRITGDQEAALWHLCDETLPETDNVTDITASEAYQRGVAKARAAMTGQPVHLQ